LFPLIIVGAVGALYLFHATNCNKNIRREQRRQRFEEKQEELLQMLKKHESKEDNNKAMKNFD
jgi:hypothetical protein